MAVVINGTSGITGNTGTLISATTIGVGGATPSASGSGVTFPATQSASTDANTLDDYEEGTFTPVLSAGSGSITSYTSSGRYTKIGNVVSVWVRFEITNNGTGGSYGQVANLPFVSAAGTTGVVRIGGTTGNLCSASMVNNQNSYTVWIYSNSYPWATNASGDIFIQYQV